MGWFSNNKVTSLYDCWVELAMQWAYKSGKDAIIKPFEEANGVIDTAMAAVAEAQAIEDDGAIKTPVMPYVAASINKLNRWAQVFTECGNSVHYEAAELIDIPFATGMGRVLDAACEWNPGDIKSEPGPNGQPAISLVDALMATLTDEELQRNFAAKAANLNTDRMPQSLEAVWADARYWENQFYVAQQCGALTEEYFPDTQAFAKEWKDKSVEEKKTHIEEFLKKLGVAMGVTGLSLVTGVEYFGGEDDKEKHVDEQGYTTWGYIERSSTTVDGKTVYDTDGIVHINEGQLNNPDAIQRFVKTFVHETRHIYQVKSQNDPATYGAPVLPGQAWSEEYGSDNKDENYWKNPMEADARAFAGMGT